MNEYLNGSRSEKSEWMPDSLLRDEIDTPVKCKLLCGADNLESFNIPKLWADDDVCFPFQDPFLCLCMFRVYY